MIKSLRYFDQGLGINTRSYTNQGLELAKQTKIIAEDSKIWTRRNTILVLLFGIITTIGILNEMFGTAFKEGLKVVLNLIHQASH